MRSRSSRLFVVLLHLVGVSTNFPSNPFLAALHPDKFRNGVGIVGVHPLSILLEPLELQAAGGLGELLALLEGSGYDVEKTVLGEPYWLQDDTDGKCLGPDGFSECGDATLWKIRRRLVNQESQSKSNSKRKAIVNFHENSATKHILAILGWDGIPRNTVEGETNTDDEGNDWEYALELVDVSATPPFSREDQNNEVGEYLHSDKGECVVSFDTKMDNLRGNLEMGPCTSRKAWSWSINEGGILKWDEKQISLQSERKRDIDFRKILLGGPLNMLIEDGANDDSLSDEHIAQQKPSQCLWRYNETIARTEPCNTSQSGSIHQAPYRRLVGLSVIQYQNTAAVSPKLPKFSDRTDNKDAVENQPKLDPSQQDEDGKESHLPHTKIHSTSRSTSDPNKSRKVPMGVGGYSERPKLKPTLSHKAEPIRLKSFNKLTPLGVGGGYLEKSRLQQESAERIPNILHHTPTTSPSLHPNQDAPLKPRKMPVHPYIAASKDGVYEDPSTGLKFLTDLHAYLGHDRKESGRHTLTGVGLYTRTMLKIKIYSVALYVPKRDVLADSAYKPFADMSVEELRANDGFYETLLTEGTVDKTLFIQLNMQLATETVRQSLSAEWQLLSDEHKKQLSDSSARPREAEKAMLEKIQSEENSSNCSCGQIAPPEYEADPSCCARGTEMVFTWRKNGNLELRIDGRVMDIFTDPIIGKGIFHEYLRGDDPMSLDARDHFADGFPFLLAPLAQVKGVSSSVPDQDRTKPEDKATKQRKTPFAQIGKISDDIINKMTTSANEASTWMQGNVKGGLTNVGNAVNAMNKNAQKFGEEFDRRRNELIDQMSAEQILNSLSPQEMIHQFTTFQKQSHDFFTSKVPFLKKYSKPEDVVEEISGSKEEQSKTRRKRDTVRHHLAEMFEAPNKRPLSDEIGVIIEPTMSSTHLLFLYMVHFYLVLLLIVSVPDLHTNRLVVRRSSVSTVDSESDHEERLNELEGISSDISCWDQMPEDKSHEVPKYVIKDNEDSNHYPGEFDEYRTKIMKKSLSYYL